jgi:uncharacterized protein DUF1579
LRTMDQPIRPSTAVVKSLLTITALALSAFAQDKVPGIVRNGPVPNLIRDMAGTWQVQQRMWPGAGREPVTLPSAVAQRRLLGGLFIEETMEKAPQAKGDAFTRVACFNYNTVNQQFEYVSLDSRAPQMMTEKSSSTDGPNSKEDGGTITLFGDIFVAPQWGEVKNAAFRYRLAIGQIEKDRQVVRLYLTPLTAEPATEFLAFEYVYNRER